MSVSKDNKRVIITMPIDLYKQIEEIAISENRSISNYIVTTMKEQIKKP